MFTVADPGNKSTDNINGFISGSIFARSLNWGHLLRAFRNLFNRTTKPVTQARVIPRRRLTDQRDDHDFSVRKVLLSIRPEPGGGRQAARQAGRGMRRPGRTDRGGDLGSGQRSVASAAPATATSAAACRRRPRERPRSTGRAGCCRRWPSGSTPRPGTASTRRTSAGGVDTLQPLLRAADVGLLRYGGGSYADDYGWETDSNIGNCLPNDATASFVVTGGGCATSDALDFDQFSAQAKAAGAQSLVTVNYGSGTPAEAAAWVTRSVSTPGDKVALWEVGNETYGCWEVDNWLARAPENYQGYIINE